MPFFPFADHCANGDLEAVKDSIKELLEESIKVFLKDSLKDNAYLMFGLDKAIQNGHLEVVKYLMSFEPDLKYEEKLIVRLAFSNGHFELVKYLMSLGEETARYGQSFIRQSVRDGQLAIVKYFSDIIKSSFHALAIRIASSYGHLEVVKFLFSLGTDVNEWNHFPLGSAAENGHLEVVKYLVSVGANIRATNDYAVRMANQNHHLEVVKYLVSVGAPEVLISARCKAYISFHAKMKAKARKNAQKKIYFWIIQKLYAPSSESAYRLGLKGYEASMQGRLC